MTEEEENTTMKRFVTKVIYILVPFFITVVSINYFIDPAMIYHKGIIEQAVGILSNGDNVEGLSNYDEREFQIQFIFAQKESPDVIALGSSRIMQLSGDMVDGSFRNHGMSGAGIYDYLGIIGVYLYCGLQPSKVVIGVDPWILNKNNGDTRYQKLEPFIDLYHGNKDIKKNFDKNNKELFELFSLSYFQTSIKQGFKAKQMPKINSTSDRTGELGVRRTDGSTSYPRSIRERKTKIVNDEATNYIAKQVYQIENYSELDEGLKTEFEKLVEYFLDKNIEVELYLPPYHPIVYSFISNNSKYKSVLDAEEYFRDYARDKHIKVRGAYNPDECTCNEEDFIDGMHMKAESIHKSFLRQERYSKEK